MPKTIITKAEIKKTAAVGDIHRIFLFLSRDCWEPKKFRGFRI